MFRLIPKDQKFFEMFIQAARNTLRGADLLKTLFTQYDGRIALVKQIREIEHDGDTITHEIIKRLNLTFITPIDREDIYLLTSSIDDVLDLIDASADCMVVFKVDKPTPESILLVDLIHRASHKVVDLVSLLGKSKDVLRYCVEINSLEEEADRVTVDAIARLFENEKDPIVVMKWKEIYEKLEEATDRCEDVANIVESIVLKNS